MGVPSSDTGWGVPSRAAWVGVGRADPGWVLLAVLPGWVLEAELALDVSW